MLINAARSLLAPSTRSEVPPFIVMDVMEAAARMTARYELAQRLDEWGGR